MINALGVPNRGSPAPCRASVPKVTGRMEFRVFGPMRVRFQGTRGNHGGRLRRALLGTLLCRANTVVSVEVPADTMRGHGAATVPHPHGHRPRRPLAEPERLSSEPGGHLLSVQPDEVDIEYFETLLDRATTSPALPRKSSRADRQDVPPRRATMGHSSTKVCPSVAHPTSFTPERQYFIRILSRKPCPSGRGGIALLRSRTGSGDPLPRADRRSQESPNPRIHARAGAGLTFVGCENQVRADLPPGRRRVMSVELIQDRWAAHRPHRFRVDNRLRSRKRDPRGKNFPASTGREVNCVRGRTPQ